MALDALLKSHEDRLVDRWTANAAGALRGRLTEAELRRQIEEIYAALLVATEGDTFALNNEASTELRVVLEDLSRTRARDGFSPTETAISVLSFKDAVLEVVELGGARSDRAVLSDVIELTKIIDQL